MVDFLIGEVAEPFDASEKPFALVFDTPPSGRIFARRLRLGDGGWPSDRACCQLMLCSSEAVLFLSCPQSDLPAPELLYSDGSGEELRRRRRREVCGEGCKSAPPAPPRPLSISNWEERRSLLSEVAELMAGLSVRAAEDEDAGAAAVAGESGRSGAAEVGIYWDEWCARSKTTNCPSAWLCRRTR